MSRGTCSLWALLFVGFLFCWMRLETMSEQTLKLNSWPPFFNSLQVDWLARLE